MTGKPTKSERLALLTETFIAHPSEVFTLQQFSDQLESAKSTLSEDIDILKTLFDQRGLGMIKSISGAAGGLYYIPVLKKETMLIYAQDLCQILKDPKRIITGGFLYTNDILYSPRWLEKIARIIITHFFEVTLDYIVTIETKGIALAMMIGRLLNKPVVTIRKSARLTEGATIQMNYMASSTKAIKTMALPMRSIERHTKVLFIDDFMKAGGSAKGAEDLLKELDVTVVGKAFLMATQVPEVKLIEDYFAVVVLESIDELTQSIQIHPTL